MGFCSSARSIHICFQTEMNMRGGQTEQPRQEKKNKQTNKNVFKMIRSEGLARK